MANDIYIGIDPEPSGAWCLWDCTDPYPNIDPDKDANDLEEVKFFTSYEDIYKRATEFRGKLDGLLNEYSCKVHVILEKVWILPGQHAPSMTKFITSFGAWKGILATYPELYVREVPPVIWKKAVGLAVANKSDLKEQSYNLAVDIIKCNNIDESCLDQLKRSAGIPQKQIYDRAEAFLMAYYGRYYQDWSVSGNDKDR